MKTIKLFKNVEGGEAFKGVNSLEVIKMIIKQPTPGEGADIEELHKRNRVWVSFLEVEADKNAQELRLEDGDYENLKAWTRRMKFGVFDPDLMTILDAIIDAKQAPKKEAKPAKDTDAALPAKGPVA